MRPGQPAEIRVDAYPGHILHGHVDSIQAGSGARFSLLPPDNATGNFVKVVRRVPVKIVLDETVDGSHVLGPGMSVEPAVIIDQSARPAIVATIVAVAPSMRPSNALTTCCSNKRHRLAYIDAFQLLTLICMACIPFVFLLRNVAMKAEVRPRTSHGLSIGTMNQMPAE